MDVVCRSTGDQAMDVTVGVAWVTVIGVVVLVIGTTVMLQWSFCLDIVQYRKKLPRGSYGWPLFGESISLMTSTPTDFAQSRVAKYGKVFKTHLYGEPTIIITCPEAARALYAMPYENVHLTGPKHSERLLGDNIMNLLADEDHKAIHNLIQKFFFMPSITPRIPQIESLIVNQLNTWDGKMVNVFHDTRKLAGNILARMLLGFGQEDHLLSELLVLFQGPYYSGHLSIPVNLPGTGFNKGLKARERMDEIITYFIEKWEASSPAEKGQDCLLKRLAEHRHPSTGEFTSRKTILDNLVVVLFAGFDTTASTFAMTLRHLWENPAALELVKAEHQAILERKRSGEPLTEDDLKGMNYTNQVAQIHTIMDTFSHLETNGTNALQAQVLHETLRLPGPVPLSLRRTAQEVEINGYTIPKGWKIVNLFTVYQQDPSYFSNPTEFDPSRFREGGQAERSKGFTPFGGGRHLCPGREIAKTNFKILMHHFLTMFRWDPVNVRPGYEHHPILIQSPKGGFEIRANLIDVDEVGLVQIARQQKTSSSIPTRRHVAQTS